MTDEIRQHPESFEESPDESVAGDHQDESGRPLKKWFFFLVALVLCSFVWVGSYALHPGPIPANQEDSVPIHVVIPRRANFVDVRQALASAAVIRDDPRFGLLLRLTGIAGHLRAGEYVFQPGVRPINVVADLKEGRVVYHPVTIPEGWELARITEFLVAAGWVDYVRFSRLAADSGFISRFDINASSLEGYLFPDTYYLSRGAQDESDILTMMVNRFLKVYDALAVKTAIRGVSRHQVVTLASIVEKETGRDDERPLVARVFLNRLEKKMPLQADPTVIYGLDGFSGSLTRQDLQTPTPYNTYTTRGLPPGPICSPGEAALAAVLNPATGNYLYFVSRNDGTHQFSETLAEHNQAVRKYQMTGNSE